MFCYAYAITDVQKYFRIYTVFRTQCVAKRYILLYLCENLPISSLPLSNYSTDSLKGKVLAYNCIYIYVHSLRYC